MKGFDITALLKVALGVITPLIPLIGSQAQSAVERAVTIPESEIETLCAGMTDDEKAEAVRLGRNVADAFSDFVVYVASRGAIAADH